MFVLYFMSDIYKEKIVSLKLNKIMYTIIYIIDGGYSKQNWKQTSLASKNPFTYFQVY